jgi:hypothetical protein
VLRDSQVAEALRALAALRSISSHGCRGEARRQSDNRQHVWHSAGLAPSDATVL